MFAESVFDQEAYSSAGAKGLMQLMPATGARMAASLDIPSLEPAHYFVPDINITLGTTYLKQLFQLFDGHLPPVIASYNAGETVVSTWWKSEHKDDTAAFIANIPYRETKNYVQKVFWYFWEYQKIYLKP
jgi:soluble lytic murein transglycosylase